MLYDQLLPDRQLALTGQGLHIFFNFFEIMLRKRHLKLAQKHMDTHLFWTDWKKQAEITKTTLTPYFQYCKDEGGDNGTTQNLPALLKHPRLKKSNAQLLYITFSLLKEKHFTDCFCNVYCINFTAEETKTLGWKGHLVGETTAETGKDAKSRDRMQFVKSLCSGQVAASALQTLVTVAGKKCFSGPLTLNV